jgi:hypothetical protein
MIIENIECKTYCHVKLSTGEEVKIQSKQDFQVGDEVKIADGFLCKLPCEAPEIPPLDMTKKEPEPVPYVEPPVQAPSLAPLEQPVRGLW